MNNKSAINNNFFYGDTQLYEGARGLSVKILNKIDRSDVYLERALELEMNISELQGADKSLLFEIVHGVIRNLNYLDWILTGFYRGQYSKCIPNVKNSMRVALYQILFLERVPAYAAVNEAVELIKKIQGKKSASLTNAVLRNIIRNKNNINFPDKEKEYLDFLSVYYSHPKWLLKRWINHFGETFTEDLIEANNLKPSLTLRVNNLKTNSEYVKNLLQKVNLPFTEAKYFSNFIKLKTLSNIKDWEFFKKGFFSVQDESTGFACKLLAPTKDMRVLDMCAAPGGKTSYLAELMMNKGEIIALEKFEIRLKILLNNMKRLGVTNVNAVQADALEYNDEKEFDRILIDAPCSGLGTITKKPDIKWRRTLMDIKQMNELQYEFLQKASLLLKVGGAIVYSTCSIDKDENFGIVNKFLENNSNYKLEKADDIFESNLLDANGCVQIYPNIHGIDGAFAAKIVRIN